MRTSSYMINKNMANTLEPADASSVRALIKQHSQNLSLKRKSRRSLSNTISAGPLNSSQSHNMLAISTPKGVSADAKVILPARMPS